MPTEHERLCADAIKDCRCPCALCGAARLAMGLTYEPPAEERR